MIKGIKHNVYQACALLLIAVMTALTFNQSVNMHTHILNDGSIISHAHPYQKTDDAKPVTSHSHNMKEFSFINQLSVLFTAIFIALAILLFPICHRKYIPNHVHLGKCDAKLILGRAPPMLVSLKYAA